MSELLIPITAETHGWFDSHCHFDFEALDADRDSDWPLARRLGVRGGMIPGVSHSLSHHLPQFTARWPGWYFAAGLHPYWCNEHQPGHLHWLAEMAEHPRAVAIGECGLDKPLAQAGSIDLETQWHWLRAQLDIAEALQRPLVLHVRGFHDELLAELRRRRFAHGGLVHAFSGSVQQGEKWHELGFCLGVGGAMTHPRATRLRQTLTQLPLTALLLETDAPDMPAAFWGRATNSPVAIPLYGAALAALRGMEIPELRKALEQNLYRVFPRITLNPSDNVG